jgi:Helix-turn-helix domain
MHRDGIALSEGQRLTACPPPSSRLGYTPVEVAGLIGKHPKTVREWCRRGVLPSRRLAGAFYISPRALAVLLDEEAAP